MIFQRTVTIGGRITVQHVSGFNKTGTDLRYVLFVWCEVLESILVKLDTVIQYSVILTPTLSVLWIFHVINWSQSSLLVIFSLINERMLVQVLRILYRNFNTACFLTCIRIPWNIDQHHRDLQYFIPYFCIIFSSLYKWFNFNLSCFFLIHGWHLWIVS